MIQVISLTGTLSNTGKNRISTVLCGNVTDQFLNQNRLANSRTAKQTDLAALLIWAQKVYHLDTGLQNLCLCGLLLKSRRLPVNRKICVYFRLLFIVNRLTQNIEDTSQCLLAHRDGNRRPGCHGLHTANQAIGTAHGDTTNRIITQMLGYLGHQGTAFLPVNPDRFIDLRQLSLAELNIQNGTDDLCDLAYVLFCHLVSPYSQIFLSVSACVLRSQTGSSLY